MEGICTAVPDAATPAEGRLLPLLEDLVSKRRTWAAGGCSGEQTGPPGEDPTSCPDGGRTSWTISIPPVVLTDETAGLNSEGT